MRKEQLEILIQICGEKNLTLQQAIAGIPEMIKEFPALASVFENFKG